MKFIALKKKYLYTCVAFFSICKSTKECSCWEKRQTHKRDFGLAIAFDVEKFTQILFFYFVISFHQILSLFFSENTQRMEGDKLSKVAIITCTYLLLTMAILNILVLQILSKEDFL